MKSSRSFIFQATTFYFLWLQAWQVLSVRQFQGGKLDLDIGEEKYASHYFGSVFFWLWQIEILLHNFCAGITYIYISEVFWSCLEINPLTDNAIYWE